MNNWIKNAQSAHHLGTARILEHRTQLKQRQEPRPTKPGRCLRHNDFECMPTSWNIPKQEALQMKAASFLSAPKYGSTIQSDNNGCSSAYPYVHQISPARPVRAPNWAGASRCATTTRSSFRLHCSKVPPWRCDFRRSPRRIGVSSTQGKLHRQAQRRRLYRQGNRCGANSRRIDHAVVVVALWSWTIVPSRTTRDSRILPMTTTTRCYGSSRTIG